MATEFDKYAAKGNEFISKLAAELQVTNDKAFRVLRAVLHATRNHLSVEESLHMISQLPMAVKGIYVDQWSSPFTLVRIHHIREFLDEIRFLDRETAGYDFGNNESATRAVKAVFKTLGEYISEGEFRDMIAQMPLELKDLILGSVRERVKE